MAVKLRLKRMGAKQRPFYRIVAADSRCPRDGKFIETVGTYNPIVTPAEIKIDEEKALKWLNEGAIPTDTVRNILSDQGVMAKFALSKSKKQVKVKEPVNEKKEEEKSPAKKPAAKKTTTKAKTETKTAAKSTAKKTTTKSAKGSK